MRHHERRSLSTSGCEIRKPCASSQPWALQEVELRGRLDALGDAAQAERVRQRDDRLRDRLVVAVVLEPVHEPLVDLDALDRQAREVRQARVAGAEVVDRDRHAHLLQLHERRDRLFRMRDDHALGDLEIEVPRGRGRCSRSASSTTESQLSCCSCCTDRFTDSRSGMSSAVPLDDLAARVAQHARAERLDHAGLLGDRDELVGPDHAALGIAPAQQRLDAARAARLHLDLRLVDEEELVVHQAAAHVGLELQPQLDARVHVGREEAVRVAARVLGRVHRGVGLLDEADAVLRVARIERDADRASQRRRLVGEPERRLERVAHARQHRHHLERRRLRIEARQDQHELVAAQPRDRCPIRARRSSAAARSPAAAGRRRRGPACR